ncbi:MAG: hypothetical protein KME42_18585 [Tildeniella nuda ZEHNDER 1965/U140]|jgi:hypothetical protein|nr:hypothetical protein [Tildeniella nuda ZEHNDER 1965/U140]
MVNFSRWQSKTALVLALGMGSSAIAPLTIATSATANPAPYTVAQLFPSQQSPRRVEIPAGTRLPIRYDGAEKVVVSPTETSPLTLLLARNIRSSSGEILVRSGSQIRGELRPVDGGSQFYGQEITLTDGTVVPIDATSEVVTKTQEIVPGTNTDAVLKGAAIGAGAATIISGVTGKKRITLGKILIGGGAGALGGLIFGKKRADVVVVNPNTDLTLTLNSPLALR